MANRRVLVKRRKAVRNIRKITRTMQLISTARFQAAFNRAVATRPYTEKLAELVADLSRAAGDVDHPLLRTNEGVDRAALVVLTSDRGLAGGYNANVLRTATGHLDQQPQGITTDVAHGRQEGDLLLPLPAPAGGRADLGDRRPPPLRRRWSRSPTR